MFAAVTKFRDMFVSEHATLGMDHVGGGAGGAKAPPPPTFVLYKIKIKENGKTKLQKKFH